VGVVDRRSIDDVQPEDLRGFVHCHFFAGIGGWALAAELARWPADLPLWTASCPCQPFSGAGRREGVNDPRHKWPSLYRLVRACRPPRLVGEQVARKDGYGWLDGVRADLGRENYASRGLDITASAMDSPQERQRVWWAALDVAGGAGERRGEQQPIRGPEGRTAPAGHDARERRRRWASALGSTEGGRLALGQQQDRLGRDAAGRRDAPRADVPNGSWWADHRWIDCHDGKARRIAEPGSPLLVTGISGQVAVLRTGEIVRAEEAEGQEVRWVKRVAAWKGLGNAINPLLGAQVLGALLDGP
jgi:DNA (cytosine-5)-methyltransferase 1